MAPVALAPPRGYSVQGSFDDHMGRFTISTVGSAVGFILHEMSRNLLVNHCLGPGGF
jgi:hypothetical protein